MPKSTLQGSVLDSSGSALHLTRLSFHDSRFPGKVHLKRSPAQFSVSPAGGS